MRAEARGLNLGRTSWHYDEVRRAAAARLPQARRCARVSEQVAGGAMPDFSKVRPLRRVPAALRSHALRAASRRHCPRVVPPWRHTLSTRTVLLTGTCLARRRRLRRGPCEAKRHDHRPASQTGQGGGCSRSARNRRSPPLVRKKERKKTDNPREGWEDGTPPPHRDFKERSVMR